MSIPMQLLLVVAAFCVCFTEGAPDARIARAKQQRPTRGFKNLEMMTARGFGKRGRPSPRTEHGFPDQTSVERSPIHERIHRTPTFSSMNKTPYFAIGSGKRATERDYEADIRESCVDQTPLDRTYRTPTFKNKSPGFAYGTGKRAMETEFEGDIGDYLLPERTNRALLTFINKVPTSDGIGTYAKRTAAVRNEGDFEELLLPEGTGRVTRVHKPTEPPAPVHAKRSPEIVPEDEEYRIRRMDFKPDNHQVRVAIGYGKRGPIKRVYGLDNFWETLASPDREAQDMDDDKLESIPMDWFVNEIVNNPEFARSVLRKFVDLNQDGMLSSDELLRNV